MVRRVILTAVTAVITGLATYASEFEKNFCDSTLRIDYIFGGGPSGVHVMRAAQSKSPGWYGRRSHLSENPNMGNGSVQVLDPDSGEVLYTNPFSSLFQEWLDTDESKSVDRSFENSFIVPLPKGDADIQLTLLNNRHEEVAKMKYRYRRNDELVAITGGNILPHRYLHKGDDPRKAIDIALVAEGYTEAEMDSFIFHAQRAVDEMLSYEPYKSNKDKLNFVAVMSPSNESGVSIPLKKEWKDTAFGSHFSTFYSPRYLTVPDVAKMYDALEGIPFENIMVLVNTDNYGGGGIYNCYHIAAARNEFTLPVSVHEFGHSFAGLADEYFYKNEPHDQYPLDIEPWEANITTFVDFESKWKDMVDPSTPIPTPWEEVGGTREERQKYFKESAKVGATPVGAYEGGGYKEKGVYRPTVTCRMRDNYYPSFCPVCERAIKRIIDFYTEAE